MTSNPQQPRLGPAWSRKGSGFQPPPAVPDSNRSTSNEGRTRSGSGGDRKNPFSALDDDEHGTAAPPAAASEGRFSALSSRGGFHRSSSSGQGSNKPRSLADLAASVPPTRRNTTHGAGGGGGGSGYEQEKVIRYTREKLLSLRPRPKEGEELPDCLKGMEGSVVVSLVAQDPGEFFHLMFWEGGDLVFGWILLFGVLDFGVPLERECCAA